MVRIRARAKRSSFEVVEEASGQDQVEGAVVGGQVGGGAQDVAGGRGGLGAGRGRQVCEGVLEGVGVDVVEDQAVGGVQESRVDSAQVGGASGRYQQDAAAGGARGGRARDVRRVAPECGLDECGLVGNLVAVLVGDGSVQEVVVEVVAPGAGHASGLTAQDVLDDLEVAGPAASLLTAQLDHAAGVGEHLGQRCHGRRDGVLTGRGERGGESAEGGRTAKKPTGKASGKVSGHASGSAGRTARKRASESTGGSEPGRTPYKRKATTRGHERERPP